MIFETLAVKFLFKHTSAFSTSQIYEKSGKNGFKEIVISADCKITYQIFCKIFLILFLQICSLISSFVFCLPSASSTLKEKKIYDYYIPRLSDCLSVWMF